MMNYDELVKIALEMLEDGEVLVDVCNELDSYEGFMNDDRCYAMEEMNDFFCDCKAMELLEKIDFNNFNYYDDYFYFSIWGIRSLATEYDMVEHYKDSVDVGEVLDRVVERYNDIYIYDEDFKAVIELIIEAREEA